MSAAPQEPARELPEQRRIRKAAEIQRQRNAERPHRYVDLESVADVETMALVHQVPVVRITSKWVACTIVAPTGQRITYTAINCDHARNATGACIHCGHRKGGFPEEPQLAEDGEVSSS